MQYLHDYTLQAMQLHDRELAGRIHSYVDIIWNLEHPMWHEADLVHLAALMWVAHRRIFASLDLKDPSPFMKGVRARIIESAQDDEGPMYYYNLLAEGARIANVKTSTPA